MYVTNTPARRLSLAAAVNCYRQEWQPEHGFHRLKGGLLGIALRVLTLIEFVVRRELTTSGETLKGLYAGNPNRATDRPTMERLLKAFEDITLYQHESATGIRYQVTVLSPLQRRILQLMHVPESVYAPPAALFQSG